MTERNHILVDIVLYFVAFAVLTLSLRNNLEVVLITAGVLSALYLDIWRTVATTNQK